MKTADAELLMCIEGCTIDHEHWLWRWSQNLKTGRLVDIQNRPSGGRSVGNPDPIFEAVNECTRPIILIGYHLGVAAIVRSAQVLRQSRPRTGFSLNSSVAGQAHWHRRV